MSQYYNYNSGFVDSAKDFKPSHKRKQTKNIAIRPYVNKQNQRAGNNSSPERPAQKIPQKNCKSKKALLNTASKKGNQRMLDEYIEQEIGTVLEQLDTLTTNDFLKPLQTEGCKKSGNYAQNCDERTQRSQKAHPKLDQGFSCCFHPVVKSLLQNYAGLNDHRVSRKCQSNGLTPVKITTLNEKVVAPKKAVSFSNADVSSSSSSEASSSSSSSREGQHSIDPLLPKSCLRDPAVLDQNRRQEDLSDDEETEEMQPGEAPIISTSEPFSVTLDKADAWEETSEKLYDTLSKGFSSTISRTTSQGKSNRKPRSRSALKEKTTKSDTARNKSRKGHNKSDKEIRRIVKGSCNSGGKRTEDCASRTKSNTSCTSSISNHSTKSNPQSSEKIADIPENWYNRQRKLRIAQRSCIRRSDKQYSIKSRKECFQKKNTQSSSMVPVSTNHSTKANKSSVGKNKICWDDGKLRVSVNTPMIKLGDENGKPVTLPTLRVNVDVGFEPQKVNMTTEEKEQRKEDEADEEPSEQSSEPSESVRVERKSRKMDRNIIENRALSGEFNTKMDKVKSRKEMCKLTKIIRSSSP